MCKDHGRTKAKCADTDISSSCKQNKAVWQSSTNWSKIPASSLPTKGDIKAAIPKECFERSTIHSLLFVLRDLAMAAALVLLTSKLLSTEAPSWSSMFELKTLYWFVGWNFYAFWQGCILTGIWVLGHECGHGAFSSSDAINDLVGFVLHQLLLVPYFAWQYTHSKHHRRTNHLVDGESHVPSTGTENGLGPNNERLSFYAAWHEAMGDGAFAAFQVFTHLVLGWPLYLLGMASTGRLAANGQPTSELMDHFRPWSPMFPKKIRHKIALSTITFAASLCLLVFACSRFGALQVWLWYGFPYMWVNCWLVLYTWLQHTDPSVPQYGEDQWTWVKGALATIDRPYGIFDFFHHNIGSTHVAHHLFHEMPFYKAPLATKHLKQYLGPLYNYDPTPFYITMWRVAHTCHYVQDTKGVQYYKSFEDVPRTTQKSKTV